MSGAVRAARLSSGRDLVTFQPGSARTARKRPAARPVEADKSETGVLDLRRDDVEAFVGHLHAEPFKIHQITQDVALTILGGAWTDTASERLYAVARWCVRHYLASKASDDVLAVVGSSLAFGAQALRSVDVLMAARLAALAEVLDEHLRARSLATPDRVLRMAHVPEILAACARLSGGSGDRKPVARKDLIAQTGLGQSNLTRIMGWLVDAGLVEETLAGREVQYRLADAYWRHAKGQSAQDRTDSTRPGKEPAARRREDALVGQ